MRVENKKILRSLGRDDQYSWDRPARISPRVNLTSYAGAKYILERPQEFKVVWGDATVLTVGKGGWDFTPSGDSPSYAKQKKLT